MPAKTEADLAGIQRASNGSGDLRWRNGKRNKHSKCLWVTRREQTMVKIINQSSHHRGFLTSHVLVMTRTTTKAKAMRLVHSVMALMTTFFFWSPSGGRRREKGGGNDIVWEEAQ